MTKPIKAINDFFSTLRVLLTRALLDKQEVIRWADSEIMKADIPESYLIELSLIGTKTTNELYEIIDQLSNNSRSLIAGRALIGFIGDKIKNKTIDYQQGFEILYSIQSEFELTDLEKNFINHAHDELELAIKQVWGDKDDVQQATKNFLNCYEGFTLDNMASWDKISNGVDENLKMWHKQ